ncbi:hypothetical protein BKA93DRAFT_742866 [Sparassis latifolia]
MAAPASHTSPQPSRSTQHSPSHKSLSPPRFPHPVDVFVDEKAHYPSSGLPARVEAAARVDTRIPLAFSPCSPIPLIPASSLPPLPLPPSHTSSPSISSWSAPTPSYTLPRRHRIANLLKPWFPIILYAATSLVFLVAIAFWKEPVFQGLDALSHWLQTDEYLGYAIIFSLIFITTFPPVPLYSTFIVLSGYTFGPWIGLVLSYLASLAGALAVFLLSRAFCRGLISRWLSSTLTIKRVVRAIEKRPKLLFLIRLAPYPYNVMNCLLAASPSLSLRAYTLCTALSLLKLIIHTTIGSSIHSFADYHVARPGAPPHQESALGRYSSIAGIALCVAIFVYLSYITRVAVEDGLADEDEDDEGAAGAGEERIAFLAARSDDALDVEEHMAEAPAMHQLGGRVPVRHADADADMAVATLHAGGL